MEKKKKKMKQIKFKYIGKGTCKFCHTKDEDLYSVIYKGKKVGMCETCIYGWATTQSKNIKEKELGKDLLLWI